MLTSTTPATPKTTPTTPAPAPANCAENNPFAKLRLHPHDALTQCSRKTCPGCGKQRRYYCSHCLKPLLDSGHSFPNVKLPLHIHILQSGSEQPQQSTAQHIAMLASTDTTLWRPFPDCVSTFEATLSKVIASRNSVQSIAILYPGENALTPKQAAIQLPQLTQLIVLDASWTKSAVMMDNLVVQCPWIKNIPKVTLPSNTRSSFWRYAPLRSEHSRYFSPDKVGSLVSTVEAVHSFCNAFGGQQQHTDEDDDDDEGQYDNLLWLFAFLHARVRDVYAQSPGKRERIVRKSKGLLTQF